MAMADRATAVLLLALGLALLVGGWTMDRLEIRQIHPASIPGLVPMILGVLLAFCALLLLRSSFVQSEAGEAPVFTGGSWTRLGLTAAISVVYALGLVGWLPYTWATFLYAAAFALIFSFPVNGDTRARVLSVGGSLVLGLAVAFGSALLFRELFLVRLP
jgi:putative tricarboxylic transport membrane protein